MYIKVTTTHLALLIIVKIFKITIMTTVIMIVTTFEIIKITITTTMVIFVLMAQPPTVLTPQLVPRGTKLQTPLVPHRSELKNYFYDFPLKTMSKCLFLTGWNFGIIFNNIYLNPLSEPTIQVNHHQGEILR